MNRNQRTRRSLAIGTIERLDQRAVPAGFSMAQAAFYPSVNAPVVQASETPAAYVAPALTGTRSMAYSAPAYSSPVVTTSGASYAATPAYTTAGGSSTIATTAATVSAGGLENVSPQLAQLYTNKTTDPSGSSAAAGLVTSGSNVLVDIQGTPGQTASLASSLQGLGMNVQSTASNFGVVTGYLPISQVSAASSLSGLVGITAVHRPVYR